MRVRLLDGGSIVIEHTQLMWNVPGPQARIPVYSVLVEHDDGLYLFGYSDKSWDYEGARFETVSGDVELAKGIRLYETPGHTVGHYSFLLKGKRPMLFAMDVAYTAAALEKGIQPGFHNNPVAGVRSIRRVKELAAEHGAQIFYSHDMDAWHGYRHAPDAYEI